MVAGLADMELYEIVFAKQLRRSKARDEIADADAILCDANLPAAALERLAALADGKPLFAIAISPAKVVRFVGHARQRRVPVHERPRGGGPFGNAAGGRRGRACQAAARGGPARAA